MYQRSSKFDLAVKSAHRATNRVTTTLSDGTVLWDTDSLDVPLSLVIDGEITAASGAIRRQGSITLIGDITDSTIEKMISELTLWRPYRGIVYPDGTEEAGSLGVLNVTNYSMDDSGRSKRHRLLLADSAFYVSDRRLTEDFSYSGDIVSAVRALLTIKNPNISFGSIAASPAVMPREIFVSADSDSWAKALELLREVGLQAHFDVNNQCVITPLAAVNTEPLWEFVEGVNSHVYGAQKSSERRKYNHVIVVSEAPNLTAPIVAHAYDTNSASPSYFYGPYGDIPYRYRSSLITTQQQADFVASSLLRKILGRRETLMISCAVNPYFEVDDVVRFVRANTLSTGNYVIERLSWPLTHDRPMYITMRRGPQDV